jgi:type I restriction enzyme, S subunit
MEQRRIAAVLNEQMASVERARAAAEAQWEGAKALPAAYLRAVFNSLEAQQWPKKRLGDVGDIASGVTLGRKVGDIKTRKVPYLRVANVKDGYLDLADVYEIDATETEIARWRLKSGDLLLTEGGDPDKLGRGTFWEEQIPECIHQNHIFRVRFRLDELLPPFVSAQTGSQYGKAYFLAHAKQTTGIATINQKVLAGFPLMVPPLAEQQRVAAMLSDHIVGVERLRQSLQAQLDAINKLPAAILREAFTGRL